MTIIDSQNDKKKISPNFVIIVVFVLLYTYKTPVFIIDDGTK